MMKRLEMGFWKPSQLSTRTSAGLSTLVHAVLITLSVVGTEHASEAAREALATIVSYLPPPNPEISRRQADETRETLRYVELAPEGPGAGFGDAGLRPDLKVVARSPDRGNTGRDTATAQAETESEGVEAYFTLVDVDTAAQRLPESAAPRYPLKMLERRVEGQAIVQFVVDTTGFADPSSFRVVLATHPEFAESVLEALPDMRFSTARIGTAKVRHLVELPFNFGVLLPAGPLVPIAV
jgi:outer membrane biosynthesis protein TonB